MAIVYANIGSNLGDRKEWIEKALDCMASRFGIVCISGFVESEPWGYESTNRFLNVGVSFKSDQEPEAILDILQSIEKKISARSHRDEEGNYRDREVDIDIMAIDKIKYQSERLTLPHKHLSNRDFFLKPLFQLAPDWQYPEK